MGGVRPGSTLQRGGPLKCPQLLHTLPELEATPAAPPLVADIIHADARLQTVTLAPEAAAYLMERLNISGDALPKLFGTASAPQTQQQGGAACLDVWDRNVAVLEQAIGGERTHERLGKMILENPALLNAEQLHTWHEFLVPGMGCPADLFCRVLANAPEVRAAPCKCMHSGGGGRGVHCGRVAAPSPPGTPTGLLRGRCVPWQRTVKF